MKRIHIILILVGLIPLFSNSVFAPQGYPVSISGNDVYGEGMGGCGIADLFRINSGTENPSLLATTSNVTLSTAINMGYYWYIDAEANYRDDGVLIPYFNVIVPLQNHRFGVTLQSMYSGNLDTEMELITTVSGDSTAYEELSRKLGNIYRMGLNYAFKHKILNAGISLKYYFGNDVHYWSLNFEDTSYQDSKYEIEKRFSGFGLKAGISRKFGDLSLGVSYEPGIKLNGDSFYKFNFPPDSDTLQSKEDIFEIPGSMNLGATYLLSNTIKFGIDYRQRFWSETSLSYEDDFSGAEELYENSWRVSGGISYDPLTGYGNWYESIPIRGGLHYSRLPFKSSGSDVREYGVSLGSTLQLNSPGRKLDFALRYTWRNTGDEEGLRDESLEFSLGITGIDIFKKTPKRIEERYIPKVDPGMGVREDTQ